MDGPSDLSQSTTLANDRRNQNSGLLAPILSPNIFGLYMPPPRKMVTHLHPKEAPLPKALAIQLCLPNPHLLIHL